jgi:hypothetical protein
MIYERWIAPNFPTTLSFISDSLFVAHGFFFHENDFYLAVTGESRWRP